MPKISQARSIELFLTSGDPEGLRVATMPFNWPGHMLAVRRTQIGDAFEREGISEPGTYILIGQDEGKQRIYVGQSDDVKKRLKQHLAEKEWWEEVVVITSNATQKLDKAHGLYLERRIFEEAKKLKKAKLDFGSEPSGSKISEASEANMEVFLENVRIMLPVLGYDFLSDDEATGSDLLEGLANPTFVFSVHSENIHASAKLIGADFVVAKGSDARKEWVGKSTQDSSYAKLFSDLVEQEVLVLEGDKRTFAKDHAFKSTSAAAAVVSGRPAAGPISWALEDGSKTFKEWETEKFGG